MTKYNDILFEIASDNFGLITSAEARKAGVSNMELVQYAKRGRLERLGQGCIGSPIGYLDPMTRMQLPLP